MPNHIVNNYFMEVYGMKDESRCTFTFLNECLTLLPDKCVTAFLNTSASRR